MSIFSINLFWITIAPSYYWLMYGFGFIIGYLIIKKRWLLSEVLLDNLIFYIFCGVIFGGRIGYVLFYNLPFYLQNPNEILKFWHWWMSFFGGAIWVILAMFLFSINNKEKLNNRFLPSQEWQKGQEWQGFANFYNIADNVVTILPIWLGLWRIWNCFIFHW